MWIDINDLLFHEIDSGSTILMIKEHRTFSRINFIYMTIYEAKNII